MAGPRRPIGGAPTLAFITGALLLPFVGAAIERFGPRRVLTSGLLLIGTGVVGVSQVTAPWQLYSWNLLIGGGWAGASSTAISTTLAWHFDRRRGLALSLALTGASAGGFAIAPALVTLSHRLGFATAVPVLVLGSLAPVLPLLWIGMRRRHGAWSAARAADRRSSGAACRLATLLQTRFWSIAGPFALAISAQVGVMMFEVSYLLPLLGTGATSLALMGTSLAAAGRLVVSPLIDHLDQRPIAAVPLCWQAHLTRARARARDRRGAALRSAFRHPTVHS